MQYSKLSALAALIAVAQALQVTAPAKDAKVDLAKDSTVSWSSVSTDPTSFSIQLVNFSVNPSVTIDIADNVQTSAGSFTIPPQKDVANGGTYQINLVSKATQNTGILAQSQQFQVTGSASDDSSSSSSSSAASASSSASSAASSASSAISSSAAAASSSASSASSSISSAASSASKSASAAGASATSSTNAAASLHLASGVAGLGFVGAVIALFA